MTLAYIALGSNLASPLAQVQAAIHALGEIPHSRVVNVSSFYRTPPLGPQDQPDYLNAAVALETTLAPDALLDHTQRKIAPILKPHRHPPIRVQRQIRHLHAQLLRLQEFHLPLALQPNLHLRLRVKSRT